jgi:hypothetical protein
MLSSSANTSASAQRFHVFRISPLSFTVAVRSASAFLQFGSFIHISSKTEK